MKKIGLVGNIEFAILIFFAIFFGWLISENDWERIDAFADIYSKKQDCEADWGNRCRYSEESLKFIGPFYEGQSCKLQTCTGRWRPKTTQNHEDVAVYPGAGGYFTKLRGGRIATRPPKPHESLGDAVILNANSDVRSEAPLPTTPN